MATDSLQSAAPAGLGGELGEHGEDWPDALVLAAECAAAEGIREALPALDALSAAGAPARVRAESARLAAILTG
ncbi:hypothetical protein [Kitasatospora sp. NPDC005751]|uniref:hypothetical protein n=1 Tax=Kitasatospora sp. NPDC005751 TaxID=3157064 RepID=UPI0033C63200